MVANLLPRLPYSQAARSLLRHTVLAAVDELVRADGWASTSVSAVAQAAGVSRQTLYNEFGNRRSIAEAYIVSRLDGLLDTVAEQIGNGDDLEPVLRNTFLRFFELADVPLIQTALAADTAEVIGLVKVTNERATTRLAALFRTVNPAISGPDSVTYADSIARVAVAHAVAPTVTKAEAIDRLVRVTLTLVAPRHNETCESPTTLRQNSQNAVLRQ